MARPVWSGAISFGLVQIPVKLYPAVSSKTVAFHQLDSKTKSRIKQLRVSAETGEEVPYAQIVKGYELSSGEYVEVTEEELSGLDPKAAKTIDLDEFVDLVDIDPIFFDRAYYLAPDKAPKPYALLVQAMEDADSLDPQKVRDALAKIKFDSLYGPIAFNAHGQIELPQMVIQVQGDKVVKVYGLKGLVKQPKYPMPAWNKR